MKGKLDACLLVVRCKIVSSFLFGMSHSVNLRTQQHGGLSTAACMWGGWLWFQAHLESGVTTSRLSTGELLKDNQDELLSLRPAWTWRPPSTMIPAHSLQNHQHPLGTFVKIRRKHPFLQVDAARGPGMWRPGEREQTSAPPANITTIYTHQGEPQSHCPRVISSTMEAPPSSLLGH